MIEAQFPKSLILLLVFSCAVFAAAPAEPPTAEQVEFFESKVRPLLANKCFECHSGQAKKLQGGLRLDSRHALLAGGESGQAVVPHKPDESLVIEAVKWDSFEMPPKGKLADVEVAVLVKWIELGAPWPLESQSASPVTASQPLDWEELRQAHWAWQPVERPAAPPVTNSQWPQRDIDYFVLARLEASGLQPAPAADRRTLIRRAYFDLIGLPPKPDEVEAFVSDQSTDAFEKVIEHLLSSPHYGERWGRHWLDVARYSDGLGGFLDKKALPHAWRYRDWVIDAVNRDMPYDQFLRMQIAGDVIEPEAGTVATGFLALGPTYISDGGDPEATAQAKSETLDDRVDTLSRGLLGVTVACARCHDHKFDPVPQLDYYSLAGVFNNTNTADKPVASKQAIEQHQQAQKAIAEHATTLKKREGELKKGGRKPTPDEAKELGQLRAELEKLKASAPPKPGVVHALVEGGKADMNLAIRGDLRRKGPVAPRRFLRIIAGAEPARFTTGSGRLELADAIADPQNPLTARVFVNRVWLHHFGKALVRTPSNFGTLGEKPTHPKLLDWLAARFVERGWSLKQLHREIMLSAAYQMSSRFDAQNFAQDGDNRLVWRMNPRRLDVEAWRDALFAVTGELDPQIGGPPVDNIAVNRRTVYLKNSRNGDLVPPDEFLHTFDFPAMRATVAKRVSSVVPQQYLFMLNSPMMVERAKKLAERLKAEQQDDVARIKQAYRTLYGREAKPQEVELATAFVTGENVADGTGLDRWQQYAQVLLSSNELMHVE